MFSIVITKPDSTTVVLDAPNLVEAKGRARAYENPATATTIEVKDFGWTTVYSWAANSTHYVTTCLHHSTKTDLLADNHGMSRVDITWDGVMAHARRWAAENLDVNMDVVSFSFRKYGEDKRFHLSIERKADGSLVEFLGRDVDHYTYY